MPVSLMSMSPVEMEGSSDTSHEDRRSYISRTFQPVAGAKSGHRNLHMTPIGVLQNPASSLTYGLPTEAYVDGSPYSTSVREHHRPSSAGVPAYSHWGSDSSQLYRSGSSSAKEVKEKKPVCSTLLITTATLIVMAVLAIAAIAAYLGVMTNHSDGDKYEIRFDGSIRIIRGDNFRTSLSDPNSQQYRTKAEQYRRMIDNVYKASPLSDSFRRSAVEGFSNGSLIVHFQLFFDRRKIPAQVGETGLIVQDVLVQEVMAVDPVSLGKTVIVDIDSIKVQRNTQSLQHLGYSPRSRLQGAPLDEDVSIEQENGLEHEPAWSIEEDKVRQAVTTPATLAAQHPAAAVENDTSHPETTATKPATPESTAEVVTKPAATTTTTIVSTSSTVSTKRPSASDDNEDWRPMVVTPFPRRPVTDPASLSTAVTHDEERVGNHRLDDRPTTTTALPNHLKMDRVIGLTGKHPQQDDGDEDGDDEDVVREQTRPSSPEPATNKFSFLQWFNAQLNNAKVQQGGRPVYVTPASPSSTTTPRFYTLKPTSYSGIQPVLRPKPTGHNSTEPGGGVSSDGASELTGFVITLRNRTAIEAPPPFRVETSLSFKKETLVESPRSQKSLPIAEDEMSREEVPHSKATPQQRELHEQKVETLKDFFPPVRRPVARPQTTSKFDQGTSSLPMEALFTPIANPATGSGSKLQGTNSPIYTFKLNQGQSVHDVLTQLLADLTVGDSPADVEIDGHNPTLILAQQSHNNSLTKKPAVNKKVDDDRLKPWSQRPFRPAILNNLPINNIVGSSNHSIVSTTTTTTPSTLPVTTVVAIMSENADGPSTIEPSIHVATSETPVGNSSTVAISVCGADQFSCLNGECVSPLARCNQMRDCRDGSDEINCTCADFLRAQFLTRKICDGVVDCWDYSDENQCEWCKPGQYICPNSKVCIDRTAVCDGIRDCPVNGEDERHCVALDHDVDSTEETVYSTSGYLMVRREGRWGKLCMQNFESAVEKLRQSFQVHDLGRAVCKELTFNGVEKAERKTDSSRANSDQVYYELVEDGEVSGRSIGDGSGTPVATTEHLEGDDGDESEDSPKASTLGYTTSKCPKRQVVHVQCRDLECGVRPRLVGSRARIVGGANSTPGAWPWQAALYKEGDFQCGATLISDSWLVSAGHCFYHAQDDHWVARLGALRRGSNLLSPHEQVRVISHIFIHPGYIDTGFVNDISVLRMEEPVRFTDFIRPVCLPPPTADIKDGRLCTVIGWGQLYETGRVFPDTLQQVQLPLVSTEECRKRTLFLPLYRLTNNMFCAGFDRGGRDACLGDSGGPLMCEEPDGRWSLQGVTSNGYGCARANRPGVYTKVARYVTWINQVVNGTYRSSRRPSQCTNGHRCLLGQCLPLSHVCNGITECQSDGSDERDCPGTINAPF